MPLAPLTWFRLGGRAKHLYRPRDKSELASFLARARDEGVSVRVLGAGANVLVRDDGVDGVVLRLDQPAFRQVDVQVLGDDVMVCAGAGVDLMPLARTMSRQGYSGLEGLAGIPASVGGAVVMNAGGRFGELGDVVTDVDVLTRDGVIETWDAQRVGFRYRHSDIGDAVVLSARLLLQRDDPVAAGRRFDECFSYKERSQPLADKSAGCIFKNPPGQSAGALIDRAGLKGRAVGGASVSQRHANFIVTQRGATAREILCLIDEVQACVHTAFGIELEMEVVVW